MKNIWGSIFLLFFTVGYSQVTGHIVVDSLLKKAETFYKTNQDSAYYYANIAHLKAISLKDTSKIAKAITYKTTYMLSLKKYDEALVLLHYNLDHKHLVTKTVLGITYNNLGALYALREERDLALINYLNAIDVFSEINNDSFLARNYLNAGVIYENEGKLKLADYFYDKSLYHSSLSKNKTVNKLHENVERGSSTDFETKSHISLEALKTIKNPEESRLAAVIYHDLSKNYIENRKYEDAIKSAQKAIEIKNNIGYLQNLDFSYFILGKSQIRLNQNEEGIKNLEKAISLSEKRSLKQLMYEMVILGHKNIGDYKAALFNSEQLNTIKDSISKFQENERIAQITSQFEIEKQTKEILLLKQENQENELLISRKEKNLWKWSLVALLATLVSIYLGQKLITSIKRLKRLEKEKELIAKKVEEIALILNNKSKIYLDRLKYIKSDGNYLEFVTDDKTIIDRNKLKDILNVLPPNFVRVHRSYVINKNFIDALNSKSLLLNPNIEIPLSRTYKANIVK